MDSIFQLKAKGTIVAALALMATLPIQAQAALSIDDFSLDQNPVTSPKVFGGPMFTGSREIVISGPQYTTVVTGGLLQVDTRAPFTVLRYPANAQVGETFNLMPGASADQGAYALTYRATVPAQMILTWTLEPAPGFRENLTRTTTLPPSTSFTTSVFKPTFDFRTPFWTTRSFGVRFQFDSSADALFEVDRLELISTATVPEPGSIGLIAAGLLVVAAGGAARVPGRRLRRDDAQHPILARLGSFRRCRALGFGMAGHVCISAC